MSNSPYRIRCPEGHSCYQTRRLEKIGIAGGLTAKSRYYCDTCRNQGLDPHHDEEDMIDTAEECHNVSMGYVWSPSHDE